MFTQKKFKYLLAYTFSHKVGDELQYTESGNGRIVLNLKKEICSEQDIFYVEKIIEEECEIINLVSVLLISFSLLKF